MLLCGKLIIKHRKRIKTVCIGHSTSNQQAHNLILLNFCDILGIP